MEALENRNPKAATMVATKIPSKYLGVKAEIGKSQRCLISSLMLTTSLRHFEVSNTLSRRSMNMEGMFQEPEIFCGP